MAKAPFVLLVNPWITDFAAFDMWAKPLGLLQLASLLREGGCGVALVDCLDRHDMRTNGSPDIIPGRDRPYGAGKFPRMQSPKPKAYRDVPRRYYRHGIHPESLKKRLKETPEPDLIWVTSIMTYWYPGVCDTVSVLREIFPQTPIWLGGIYARLCSDHARRNIGVSEVVTLSNADLCTKLESATGFNLKNKQQWSRFAALPPPALDLLQHIDYAPLMTSRGCPFRCPYCASGILQPDWKRKAAGAIFEEIAKWSREYGIVDFAFYDDALLLEAEQTLKPALKRVIEEKLSVRFHTPNALHIRALTPDWCSLLHESGFVTLRLGLETTRPDRQRELGGKVEMEMFFSAVENLQKAGFSSGQIGVYLLCGLPGQSPQEVEEAIYIVEKAGAQPFLAEYSPLPGTVLWREACQSSQFDLAGEPLYHNNTFFACRRSDFSTSDLQCLKDLARRTRVASSSANRQEIPQQKICWRA